MKLLILALSLALLLTGCSSSQKVSHYTLSAAPIPAQLANKNLRVMVGPIAIPAALDRSQLVIQSGDNVVEYHEYERWAGSLKSDVGRVMVANLARGLSTPNIWSFNQSTQTNFDYQVLIDVQNLESRLSENVLLDMLWTIKFKDEKKPTVMGRSLLTEPVADNSIEALVAAQSRAFSKASDEIAQTMLKR